MTVSQNNIKLSWRRFDSIKDNKEIIDRLFSLTLHPGSGMHGELLSLLSRSKQRSVHAKVILAELPYLSKAHNKIIAWALLSKEKSKFSFKNHRNGFDPDYGTLFEIFVHPSYRRQGIGKKIVEFARKKLNSEETICFCPWDYISNHFFNNFKEYKHIEM